MTQQLGPRHGGSLVDELLARLQRGAASLSDEECARLYSCLQAWRVPHGGFEGLDGRSELYFSGFGFELAAILGLRPRPQDEIWLEQLQVADDDPVNLISLIRCRRAMGRAPSVPSTLCLSLVRMLPRLNARPYGRFLTVLVSDLVRESNGGMDTPIAPMLEEAATLPGLATTLSAALVTCHRCGDNCALNDLVHALMKLRHSAGGWRAAENLGGADLLATAVAAFALDYVGGLTRHGTQRDVQFVLAHRCPDGGFAQCPGQGRSDVESTWYALLALGALTRGTPKEL